jgi:hypothetical protein
MSKSTGASKTGSAPDRSGATSYARFSAKQGLPNAKLAYQLFRKEFSSPRWNRLAQLGANL